MPLYLPTASMEPCALDQAPRGTIFLPFGGPLLLVGEVDQHDLAIRLSGDEPFTTVPFSRDERSTVRGVLLGEALFDSDIDTAYRARDSNSAPGDLIRGQACTSIVGVHEDGGTFEVAVRGDPQRGLEAGFAGWRLGVKGRDGEFLPVFERAVAQRRQAANSNG